MAKPRFDWHRLGFAIREAAKSQGVSLPEYAELAEIPNSTFCRMAKGGRGKIEHVLKFCDTSGFSLYQFWKKP